MTDPASGCEPSAATTSGPMTSSRSAPIMDVSSACSQHGPAACLDRLPGSSPGGVRASARRMAGCATPTSSAGHAPAGATADPKLTFKPDHQAGAAHTHGSEPRYQPRQQQPISASHNPTD